jgi:hypothetical protein
LESQRVKTIDMAWIGRSAAPPRVKSRDHSHNGEPMTTFSIK